MASRDMKFDALLQSTFAEPHESIVGTPNMGLGDDTDEGIRGAVNVFQKNMIRVRALVPYMATLPAMGHLQERIACRAEYEVTGAVEIQRSLLTPAVHDKVAANMRKWIEKFDEKRMQDSKAYQAEVRAIGSKTISRHLASEDAVVVSGLEGLYWSQVIGAYTAFETLVGDLWEAAINCHPGTLSELSGKRSRIKSSVDHKANAFDYNTSKNDESFKSATLQSINRLGYDLSTQMGTLLRERVQFTSLRAIREAYSLAFSKHYDAIDKALANQSLDALSVARNVLVHRAGVADEAYRKHSNGLLNIPRANPGEVIGLDGEIVVGLVDPMLESVSALIKAVDQWIAFKSTRKTQP
jgi:hypothetical protein